MQGLQESSDEHNLEKVNIRPGVGILGALRHLPYKTWYALAEFVDNALQSYLDNKQSLAAVSNSTSRCRVVIDLHSSDTTTITIRDNAAGISTADYARAFRPAEIPLSREGLSEFGMGMKSAACWLAPKWTVRSSALGEDIERSVTFDVESILLNQTEHLEVRTVESERGSHFTEVILHNIYQSPKTKTLSKIKEHLAHIYRQFIRNGDLELWFGDELLIYDEPSVLVAPYWRTPDSTPEVWRKDIEFDFGQRLSVHGFAAIRERGVAKGAGFSLFRRGRLIQGSGEDGYRPYNIFGAPNKYVSQRLFGELHLEGFEVNHTKDGFRWDDNEEAFLTLLGEYLNAEPLPLLEQARNHRSRPPKDELKEGADKATEKTAAAVARDAGSVVSRLEQSGEKSKPVGTLQPVASFAVREVDIEFMDRKWRVTIQLVNDPAVSNWLEVSDGSLAKWSSDGIRRLTIRLSLDHPFMSHFSGSDSDEIEPLLRVAVGLALAEIAAYDSGVKFASTVREYLNEILRYGLWRP
jgi:hypothetical protein